MTINEIIIWRNKYVKQKYLEIFINQVEQWENINHRDPDTIALQYCYYLTKLIYHEKQKST